MHETYVTYTNPVTHISAIWVDVVKISQKPLAKVRATNAYPARIRRRDGKKNANVAQAILPKAKTRWVKSTMQLLYTIFTLIPRVQRRTCAWTNVTCNRDAMLLLECLNGAGRKIAVVAGDRARIESIGFQLLL